MAVPTHPFALAVRFSLVLAVGLAGCVAPRRAPVSATPDKAFIEYWPPVENGKKLRLAVKDLIDMKGVLTTAGSEFLAKNSKPAERDAACLRIARQRPNVTFVGKANLSEFAVRVTGMNTYYGTPVNPLNPRDRIIPGGSSSGSAVAVADDLADVALGTDTAGSIRVPAACCGIWGLKTTFGLVPLKGVFPIEPQHLDTIGPLAKDLPRLVAGMELLQDGFAGKYRAAMAAQPRGSTVRVGRLYIKGTDPRIDQALDRVLEQAGFTVVRLSDRFREAWEQGDKDAKTIAAAGAWLYDLKFAKESEVSATTKAVFTVGRIQYPGGYKTAVTRKGQWQAALEQQLRHVDFIALPVLKKLPPRMPGLGGSPALEARVLGLQNTAAVNFAGNPAIAIPVPVEDRRVPMTSLQLIGKHRSEAQLLNAGRLVEKGLKQ
jgi:amidase